MSPRRGKWYIKSCFAINSGVFGNYGFGSVEPMSADMVNCKLICFSIERENDELHFEKLCYGLNTLKNMSKHAMEFTDPEKVSVNKAKQRIYDQERDRTPARREKKKEIDAVCDRTLARKPRYLETDHREKERNR